MRQVLAGADSSPLPKTPVGWGVPISAPCPESGRPAGAPALVLLSIATLCFPPVRPDPPPPPPPLPPPGPSPLLLPHPHLLLSNEKVTEENPNTPAAESPRWHLAARGGGLLGSTWWSLCDTPRRAAGRLSEKRPRRGTALTGSGYLRGVREKKPPERKDKKKAKSKLPPWGGDTA